MLQGERSLRGGTLHVQWEFQVPGRKGRQSCIERSSSCSNSSDSNRIQERQRCGIAAHTTWTATRPTFFFVSLFLCSGKPRRIAADGRAHDLSARYERRARSADAARPRHGGAGGASTPQGHPMSASSRFGRPAHVGQRSTGGEAHPESMRLMASTSGLWRQTVSARSLEKRPRARRSSLLGTLYSHTFERVLGLRLRSGTCVSVCVG